MSGHKQVTKFDTSLGGAPENDIKTIIEKKKDAIPAVIADSYCREILHCTETIPKSAMEISMDTRIPISTVYRRVQTLCDVDLLQTSGIITEDGKKSFLYKSSISEIYIKFDGSLQVTVVPKGFK